MTREETDTDKKNRIVFDSSDKQSQFIELALKGEYKYMLFGGAIRGGKTYAGLGALILLCKKYPRSRWAVVRDTLPTLKRTTIPSFNKLCPGRFKRSYHQGTQTVTFDNGAQILFFAENYDSDKELNRWKGLEVNGFLLEEANELQEVSFYKAIERAGAHIPKDAVKPDPLILLTCNPAKNWVKTLFYDRAQTNTLPPDWLYIQARITDNPYIMADAGYVASLKNMPRYQYEVYVDGNWELQIKTGGEYYKCFELDKHVGKCLYDPAKALHMSWDDNVNPYLPCGIFQMEGSRLYMIAEIAGVWPGNSVKAVCAEFARLYPNHRAGLFVYGDATANKQDTKMEQGYNFYRLICDHLCDYKPSLRVMQANPSVVMRGNFINTVLEKEVYGCALLIDDGCKHTISDFVLTKEAADGTKNKQTATDPNTKVNYQATGHFTDLCDYIMCRVWATEFERYQRGGRPMNITTGKNQSKNSY